MPYPDSTRVYCLIMAGGSGERLKPLSSPDKPKQFIPFELDKGSLLQETVNRMFKHIFLKNILVAINKDHKHLTMEQLPFLNSQQLILESKKKNTAPTIAYATRFLSQKDSNSILIVLPADHYVADQDAFWDSIYSAVSLADSTPYLVTIGLKPTFPSIHYGYIKPDLDKVKTTESYLIEKFVEKPIKCIAKRYIKEGYVWNSGIFVGKVESFKREFIESMPDLWKLPIKSADKFFKKAPSISIDYGLMERCKSAAVVCADFGWTDLGSFEAIKEWRSKYNIVVTDEVLEHII